jgi:hypothetical protein
LPVDVAAPPPAAPPEAEGTPSKVATP